MPSCNSVSCPALRSGAVHRFTSMVGAVLHGRREGAARGGPPHRGDDLNRRTARPSSRVGGTGWRLADPAHRQRQRRDRRCYPPPSRSGGRTGMRRGTSHWPRPPRSSRRFTVPDPGELPSPLAAAGKASPPSPSPSGAPGGKRPMVAETLARLEGRSGPSIRSSLSAASSVQRSPSPSSHCAIELSDSPVRTSWVGGAGWSAAAAGESATAVVIKKAFMSISCRRARGAGGGGRATAASSGRWRSQRFGRLGAARRNLPVLARGSLVDRNDRKIPEGANHMRVIASPDSLPWGRAHRRPRRRPPRALVAPLHP